MLKGHSPKLAQPSACVSRARFACLAVAASGFWPISSTLLAFSGQNVAFVAGDEEVDSELPLGALRALDDRLGGLVLVGRQVVPNGHLAVPARRS